MNVRDGLVQIRGQLMERDARTETLELVDTMIKRASEPGADRAQASLVSDCRAAFADSGSARKYPCL